MYGSYNLESHIEGRSRYVPYMEISSINPSPLGVRKGAWTEEEDHLLRKCIEKNGEGKWHLVPHLAGLNRCRKSCRLRWLNYLRPNIKRGGFTSDEIDLIVRLHKLLGNRWSLIAGRLPNRTANDVKNYWNTHLRKKLVGSSKELEAMSKTHKIITKANIIRPRPRTFTGNPTGLMGNGCNIQSAGEALITKPSPTSPPHHHGLMSWWDNMEIENDNGNTLMSIGGLLDDDQDQEQPINIDTGLWGTTTTTTTTTTTEEVLAGDNKLMSSQESQINVFGDFSIDVDLWNFLGHDGIDSTII